MFGHAKGPPLSHRGRHGLKPITEGVRVWCVEFVRAMRLAPNRPSGLMASTQTKRLSQEVEVSELAVAVILAAAILAAATISVELGISVALIELALGVVVGNAFDTGIPDWLSFIGTFAGIVLTFLAGAEVDVPQFKREWKASLLLGSVSFAAPFLVCMAFAYWALGWSADAAQIAGIALSTTSLAVVYAVLVETGLNQTIIGKRIMSATFVTDFGTAAALSILFIKPNLWILAFASLFLLMWLGDKAHSHAVLPAFVLGLALSNHYATHRTEQERLRVVAFAFLTPLFFFKGGMSVTVAALWANLGVLALLFGAKMLPKLVGVYPLARRYCAPHSAFTTLLMSTGLTFGTISSLYGLQAGITDETQFSLLVAVVVLSAIVPTVIAQRFFQPNAAEEAGREQRITIGKPLLER